ncbi:bile acid:sodium symporter family protein [Endozoicomonas montiporae]|uniref:Bile acid:sodium symporter n=1 Tax=Endozoicomonas montiporae CL-33 TaxID=570277 RepID=A0A142B6R5_9GAMM|nr:bile acid:sodium symporter family protein [Endozoicomonas montiporae]AMO54441.1 bile acid:sodium symporter [Endozoicomonas montiporae CL-33]
MEANLGTTGVIVLNIISACVMFGVALSLKVDDFTRIIKKPKAPAVGMVAQFMLLPGLSTLAAYLLNIPAEYAAGMILIACCPGGSISNMVTYLARGNVAVSVSMSAASSVMAIAMTPFNFAFYGSLLPQTRGMIQSIAIDASNILFLIVTILAIPMIIGMYIGNRFPRFATSAEKPFRILTFTVLLVVVLGILSQNLESIKLFGVMLAGILIGQNAMAMLVGYLCARVTGLPVADQRAITFEVGIQNSVLGVAIIVTFYPEMFGMLQIVGMWGMWHLISGLTLAHIWSRKSITAKTKDEPVLEVKAG